MADRRQVWYYPNMVVSDKPKASLAIPTFSLFGENGLLPDILHCERIVDRAAGHEWKIYPHRHAHLHQFFLIQTSGAVLRIEGEVKAIAPLSLVSIPPWFVHAFEFPVDTQGYVLTIPIAEFSEVFFDERTRVPGLTHWAMTRGTAEIVGLFEALLQEFDRPSPQRQLIIRSMAGVIASRVSQVLENIVESGQMASQIMRRFEALVRNNFRDRKNISYYAEHLGMSVTHLNRIVRANSGHSTLAYIEIVIFNEACRQIAYTRKTIAEIGFQLGFDDPSYFSRSFKRLTGISPIEYRMRAQ